MSTEWFPALLLLLIFLVTLLSIRYLRMKSTGRNSMKGLNLPPGPPKLPILGNLHQLGRLPHRSLAKLSQDYGPIMFLQLGNVPTLVISSPGAAKEVLKTHDLDTCSRPRSPGPGKISYGYSDVAFAQYGDYWREVRKILIVELLTMKRLHSFRKAREEEVSSVVEFLFGNSSKPVELNGKIFALTDGIVGNTALGKFYGREQFGGKNFQHVLDEAMTVLSSFSTEDFFPTWWGRAMDKFSGHTARLEKCFRDLDGYFQMVLDKHRSSPMPAEPGSEDFVDALISLQKDPKNSITLTDEKIKAMIMNIFLGGTDTSALTILWAMSELIKNPRVMKKVQTEVRSCTGRKPRVEVDDVARTKYLKMVVKETLRLHPPAPLMLPHETIRRCQIGGYDVLPGTRVIINAWAIGRDPTSWENPEEFNPDRFEGTDIDFKGQNFELLPFGSGRRMCPGLAMAVTTVEYALASLLYSFDWELPHGMSIEDVAMEEEGGITVHKKVPLSLVPVKYDWQQHSC